MTRRLKRETYCQHHKQKSVCVACAGIGVCKHGRRKRVCKPCAGGGFCPHGRQKSRCKLCGGKGICEHSKRRNQCKVCLSTCHAPALSAPFSAYLHAGAVAHAGTQLTRDVHAAMFMPLHQLPCVLAMPLPPIQYAITSPFADTCTLPFVTCAVNHSHTHTETSLSAPGLESPVEARAIELGLLPAVELCLQPPSPLTSPSPPSPPYSPQRSVSSHLSSRLSEEEIEFGARAVEKHAQPNLAGGSVACRMGIRLLELNPSCASDDDDDDVLLV